MVEILRVYDLEGHFLENMERKKYYKQARSEYRRKGSISRTVAIVKLLLFRSDGKMLLTKRSSIKKENPLLWDKALGGHQIGGEDSVKTLMRECTEELGINIKVVDKKFKGFISLENLSKSAVVRLLEKRLLRTTSVIYKNRFTMQLPKQETIYLGIYDGPIVLADGEVAAIKYVTLTQALHAIKIKPSLYTDDIKQLVKHYTPVMKSMLKELNTCTR
ncbi:NUDIX domain-containing protein [Candidatus Woesearchaeota archaeon]|nr:NUDIX domain-containing protein [Candidatus Woesearchaeota archaeon]